MAKGKIVRPSDGKEAKSVAFIQSPGQSDSDSDFSYTDISSILSPVIAYNNYYYAHNRRRIYFLNLMA